MSKLPKQIYRNSSKGLVQPISSLLTPIDSVYFSQNLEFDTKIGVAKIRKGTARVGNQIENNAEVLGVHQFISTTGTEILLAAVNDGTTPVHSDIYSLTGVTWTKRKEDLTKDIKTRFLTYLDTVVAYNGTDAASCSVNGTVWAAANGNLDGANFPLGNVAMEWNDRVYASGVSEQKTRLFYSSTPKIYLKYDGQTQNFTVGATLTGGTSGATATISEDTDSGTTGTLKLSALNGTFQNNETITDDETPAGSATTNGTNYLAISWTSGNGYIDIEPEDGGGDIIALAKVPGYLLIFKERSLKRWNGSSTFPDDLYKVGAASMEAVCLGKGAVYFFSADGKGIYATAGSYPALISKPVQYIIDAIPSSYYTSVSSHSDGEDVRFSIGDITLDGLDYNNCVLKYNIGTQTWSLMTYGTEAKVWTTYKTGGATYTIFGDDDGDIMEIKRGTEDVDDTASVVPIEFTYQTHELEFSDTIQEITRLVVHTRYGKNSKVLACIDNGDWKEIGSIKNDNQLITCSLRGTRFQFRVSGSNEAGEVEIGGFTYLQINKTDNYK